MSRGLLIGHDAVVAAWTWGVFGLTPMPVNIAVGVVDDKGMLVGSALFQNFNSHNVDFSYYGRKTLTGGIARSLARAALNLGVSRVTIMTSKRNKRVLRFLPKLGCKLEGTSRCYYGQHDEARSTAVRFVLFRADLERIAGHGGKKEKVAC